MGVFSPFFMECYHAQKCTRKKVAKVSTKNPDMALVNQLLLAESRVDFYPNLKKVL